MEEEELLKRKNKELEEIAEMKRQHELKKRENEVAITESQREKARYCSARKPYLREGLTSFTTF